MKTLLKKVLKVLLLAIMVCFLAMAVYADDSDDEETDWSSYFPKTATPDFSHNYYAQSDLFTGNASYTYDFNLPPGTAGMEPDLKLVYRSDNENGWFGMGWDLGGFSYIERSRRLSVPDYDNADTFLLNLNGTCYELVKANSNSSGVGYYRTKNEVWLNIYFDGSVWTVKTKDGRELHFGCKVPIVDHSSYIRRWAVDQVTDKCGNYMTYTYTIDTANGEYYPESIVYTQNSNLTLSKTKTISFTKASRTDNIFPEGRWMSYRISAIQIKIDDTVVDKYTFNYSYSNCSYRSLLKSIYRYGSGSTPEITNMTYQSESGSISWSEISTTLPVFTSTTTISTQGKSMGDVDGDGLIDYIVTDFDSSWQLQKITEYHINSGDGSFGSTSVKIKMSSRTEYPYLKHVNGDRFADVLTSSDAVPYINNGSLSWVANDDWQATFFTGTNKYIDINNDGIRDIFTGIQTKLSSLSGTGWSTSNYYKTPNSDLIINYKICNVNGDNWPDLIHIENYNVYLNNQNGNWIYDGDWIPHSNVLKDYNGDGLIDNVYQSTVYLNNTHGWSADSRWDYIDSSDMKEIDVNGDGLFDLIDDSEVHMRQQNGTIVKNSVSVEGTSFKYINDDPFPDVIKSSTGQIFLSNVKPDLLSEVKTCTGGEINYEYKRVPFYPYLSNGKQRGETFRKYVISKITTNEGTERDNSSYSTSFEYSTGMYNRTERMSLGFEWVKKIYPNDEYTIINYYQDIQRAGRVSAEETYNSSGNLILSQTNTWTVDESVSGSPGYAVLLTNQVKTVSGSTSFESKAVYTYDDYGNVTKEEQLGELDVTGDEVTYEREYINDISNWLIGFKCREQTVDANGDAVADQLTWYDGLSLGNISEGLVSEEKSWLDQFNGTSCSNSSFYSENSSRPNLDVTDSHPVIKYTYDTVRNVITKTRHNVWQDGNEEQTETIQYDRLAYCLPVMYSNAKGHTTTFTVDYVVGKPLTITDPNGGITQFLYDSLGRLTAEYGPEDSVNPKVKYDYSNALTRAPSTQYINIQRQVNAGGSTYLWNNNYLDGFGRIWRDERQAPNDKVVWYDRQYEWNGLLWKEWAPIYRNSSIFLIPDPKVSVYDSLQRPISITELTGAIVSYSYNGLTTTVKVADSSGTVLNQCQQTRDAFGRLVGITQVNDTTTYTTSYNYDCLNRLTSKTDANNKISTMTYDSLGRMLTRIDPFTGSNSFRYDLVGNLIYKTDNAGNSFTFAYDKLNRQTVKSVVPAGATNTTVLSTMVYDETSSVNGIGKLTTAESGNSTTDSVFKYDLDGKVTETTKYINGIGYTTKSNYDAQNRLTDLTYPDNTTVNYTYEADSPKTVGTYATISDWSVAGTPKYVTYGNNVGNGYQYNLATNQLIYILTVDKSSGTLLQRSDYGYDAIGNIKVISDDSPLTTMHAKKTSQTFKYDMLNRLVSSSVFGTYAYDAVGNITSKEGVSFTYGDNTHPYCLTASSDGIQAGYDFNGNLSWKKDKDGIWWKYTYDTENQLTQVYQGSVQGSETLYEVYSYDTNGIRTKKVNYSNNTTTIYVNYGNNVLCEKTGTNVTKYILFNGKEIAREDSTGTYYTHRDHIGSALVRTDSNGALVGYYANHPYGEDWSVGTGSMTEKYRFTGKETDETGLLYFGARFYDPVVGRFISVDPAKNGDNWYVYANDNPLKYIDPNGQEAKNVFYQAWASTERGIWNAIIAATLDSRGYDVSATCMRHTLQDNPSSLHFGQNDSVTQKILGSSEWKSTVDKVISANATKDSFTLSSSMAFNSGDLFLALHNVNYSIDGIKIGDTWSLSTVISDHYDFKYNNETRNFLANTANNFAYWDQELGLISDYYLDITFTQEWSGGDE